MASSIGGGFETSIMMDVSGIRVASERGIEYMDNLSGSAVRVGQTFDRTSGETNALTESLRRAGQMVELLSAKMLAQQVSAEKARIATSEYSKSAAQAAESQRSLTSLMMGGNLAATRQAEEAAAAVAKYNANLERSKQLVSSGGPADPRSLSTMIGGGSLAASRSAAAAGAYASNAAGSRSGFTGGQGDSRSLTSSMMGGSLAIAQERELAAAREQRLLQSAALADDFANRQEAHYRAERRWIEDNERFRQQGIQQRERMEAEAAERRAAYDRETLQIQDAFQQRNESAYRAERRWIEDNERFRQQGIEQRKRLEKEAEDARIAANVKAENDAKAREARERSAWRASQRQQADAARFRAGAQDPLRTNSSNVSGNFRSVARDAVLWERGRVAQEGAELSVRRMKAMLSPMVEMEMRLADEAREFKQQLDLATRSGHVNLAQAKLLTKEFEEQQKLLLQNAQQQQAGFLGMRRMGFAAQQFGYAIEDAASQYGTMGLSGAFRAAGNNLTAMAAVMGPQVGVAASIAAAVASIGLHWWETKKAAEATAKENERVLELTERIQDHAGYLLEINSQIHSARTADHAELSAMYDRNLEQIREISALENSRLMAQKQLLDLTKEQNALREIEGKIAADNAQWYEEQFRWTFAIGRYLRDAGSGVMSLFESDDAARLAEERFNSEARIAIEMQRQENALKRANSEAQKQLDLANQQSMLLRADSAKIDDRRLSNRNGEGHKAGYLESSLFRESGGYDVARKNGMKAQVQNFGEHRYARSFLGDARQGTSNSTSVETGRDLRVAADMIVDERNRLLQLEQQQNLTIEQRLELQKQIAAANNEYLRVQQMAFDLEKRGKEAYEETNNTLMGRFEGLNEELRIENEIVRTRKKLNEEIAIAERSGHMDADKAAAYRAEMERVFQIEEQNRKAEKEIERLKKEEAKLERVAAESLAPAGVVSGLTRGSDETRKFLEQEKMRNMAQKDSEPVVAELKLLREEMKRQRSILEKNATSTPTTAELL